MPCVRQVLPLDAETARMVRRLDFIKAEAESARAYFEALQDDPAHGETLDRLPQLPELLDGYLKLMFEEADDIRRMLGVFVDDNGGHHETLDK